MKTISLDNKTWIRGKAILLPTEDKTILIKDKGKLEVIDFPQVAKTINSIVEGFHFYITDDSEIKEGDWYLIELFKIDGSSDGFHLEQCKTITDVWVNGKGTEKDPNTRHIRNCKKVIATTNTELIKDGVPQIPEEFIKQWVNNPQEDVLVEVEEKTVGFIDALKGKPNYFHQIKTSSDNTVNLRFVVDDWDSIYQEYVDKHHTYPKSYSEFINYLRDNFNPPKRKEK